MRRNQANDNSISFGKASFQVVESYTYLGRIVKKKKKNGSRGLKIRMQKARIGFTALEKRN